MAGDWIKMRVNLVAHPRVLKVAERLLSDQRFVEWSGLAYGLPGFPPPSAKESEEERYVALRLARYVVVTALLRFWGYANEHAKKNFIPCVTPKDVEEITGVPGFSDALAGVGWIVFNAAKGGVKLPDFEKHNTSADVRTSRAAERQKRYRKRKKRDVTRDVKRDVTRDVTFTNREEKRRVQYMGDIPQTPLAAGAAAGAEPDPLVLRLFRLFNRRATTRLSEKERTAFRKAAITVEDLVDVEDYYGDSHPEWEGKNIRRRDIQTLLNNWKGEVTRAAAWKANKRERKTPDEPAYFKGVQ
jgi:hypothetical protein